MGSVVDRAYELISFAGGDAPRWDAFRQLCINGQWRIVSIVSDMRETGTA